MGFQDRDYSRDGSRSFLGAGEMGLYSLTPVVKYLLFANIAVFLLQLFVVREDRRSSLDMLRRQNPELDKLITQKEQEGPEALEAFKKKHHLDEPGIDDEEDAVLQHAPKASVIQEWFELDTRKVVRQGQVWRLLTHAFCHDRHAILHIVFNMLLLYWFGGTLESMYGSREFLLFYLTAAVLAGLTFVGLDLWLGTSVPGIGASGAVMAVMMLYTMHFPRETICICWFFPVEMRWIMLFYLIYDLHPVLLALSGDRFATGIAHGAHLGGLAFGFLYAKFQWRLEPIVDRFSSRSTVRQPKLLHRPRQACARREPDVDVKRLDELLEKISVSGQASLTDEERAVLQAASERIKKRSNRSG